jgi:SpoVK/Ycf46/Vps4 family AAA+-type ATPase
LVIRLLDDIFELAKQYAPCVIVFEEVDLMIKNREKNLTTDENMLLAYFLDMINLILAQKLPIVLLAATNYKDSLDEAFLRQGRFGDHIFIDYPTRDDIKDIIENKLIFYPIKEVSQFINFYDILQLLSNKKYTTAKVIDYIRRLNDVIAFWGLGTPHVEKINKELAITKINDTLSRDDNEKLFKQLLEKFHKNMQIIK